MFFAFSVMVLPSVENSEEYNPEELLDKTLRSFLFKPTSEGNVICINEELISERDG